MNARSGGMTALGLLCVMLVAGVRAGDEAPARMESFEINGIQVAGAELSCVSVYENANLVCFFRAQGRHVPATVLSRGDPSMIRTIRSIAMKQGCLVIEHDRGVTSLNPTRVSRIEYSENGLSLYYQ